MSLLPVAEGQARLLALAAPLPAEMVSLGEAAGRYAAGPVASLRRQPAADLSAMDGYAIRFAERPGPWTVMGESVPGRPFPHRLAAGQAARIFTGAPMPDGSDTVLVQEEASRAGDSVAMTGDGPPRAGAHVRRAGSVFDAGNPLVEQGALMTAGRIALAAMGGHGALSVGRRPRVVLISTGDELVPAGAPTPGLALPSSNAPMIAALLGGEPALVDDRGIVPDDAARLTAAFRAAAGAADVIVTTGGASVGDHDLVRPCLEAAGGRIDFWRLALKPGKPLIAGRLGGAILLGLPGNPVSAHVTATLFLLPLVRHLAGAATPFPDLVRAPLAAGLPATGQRAEYLRARLAADGAVALVDQDSAGLGALAQATHLIVRPPHAPAAAAGDTAFLLPIA